MENKYGSHVAGNYYVYDTDHEVLNIALVLFLVLGVTDCIW